MQRSTLAPLLLTAWLATGCLAGYSYKDGSKLHRRDENGAVEIPRYPVGACGTVTITASVGDAGTDIRFAFEPKTPPPEGCCESYGWIQHVTWGGRWTYDNAAGGESAGTGAGHGAPSDPAANPQGSSSGERWSPVPWYGGTGNLTTPTPPDGWAAAPRPQTTIHDQPGGPDGFVTQLVCVETGRVLFQYRWLQQRERGSLQWRFVGAEGENLTIRPD